MPVLIGGDNAGSNCTTPADPPWTGNANIEMPADGDDLNVSSIAQPLKMLVDYAKWATHPRSAPPNVLIAPVPLRKYADTRGNDRYGTDQFGFPGSSWYTLVEDEDWSWDSTSTDTPAIAPATSSWNNKIPNSRWYCTGNVSGSGAGLAPGGPLTTGTVPTWRYVSLTANVLSGNLTIARPAATIASDRSLFVYETIIQSPSGYVNTSETMTVGIVSADKQRGAWIQSTPGGNFTINGFDGATSFGVTTSIACDNAWHRCRFEFRGALADDGAGGGIGAAARRVVVYLDMSAIVSVPNVMSASDTITPFVVIAGSAGAPNPSQAIRVGPTRLRGNYFNVGAPL